MRAGRKESSHGLPVSSCPRSSHSCINDESQLPQMEHHPLETQGTLLLPCESGKYISLFLHVEEYRHTHMNPCQRSQARLGSQSTLHTKPLPLPQDLLLLAWLRTRALGKKHKQSLCWLCQEQACLGQMFTDCSAFHRHSHQLF